MLLKFFMNIIFFSYPCSSKPSSKTGGNPTNQNKPKNRHKISNLPKIGIFDRHTQFLIFGLDNKRRYFGLRNQYRMTREKHKFISLIPTNVFRLKKFPVLVSVSNIIYLTHNQFSDARYNNVVSIEQDIMFPFLFTIF